MSETQRCLLDAAEALFIERGYAATSLRSIAEKAGANLAATHYHFGSKEGLFEAVIHRRVTPVNKARLAALDQLQAKTAQPDLRAVLRAFLEPALDATLGSHLPALVGRIHSEPAFMKTSLLEKEFGEVISRFETALSTCLPNLPLQDLQWRFHFLVGSMLHVLSLAVPVGAKNLASNKRSNAEALEKLIDYAAAGFDSNSA